MSAQHTPTPWSVCSAPANDLWYVGISIEASGARVADTCILNNHHTEDAAFIVRACNAHDELVAALREIDHAANHRFANCEPGPMKRMPPELREAIIKARAALAKAGAA